MLGVSYLAIKQWQVAALRPPHLAAIIPWEGMFDHSRLLPPWRHLLVVLHEAAVGLADRRQPERQRREPVSRPFRRRALDRRGDRPAGAPGNLSNLFETGLQHRFDDAYYRPGRRGPGGSRCRSCPPEAQGGLGLHLRGNVIAFEQAASGEMARGTSTRISPRCTSPKRSRCRCASSIISSRARATGATGSLLSCLRSAIRAGFRRKGASSPRPHRTGFATRSVRRLCDWRKARQR